MLRKAGLLSLALALGAVAALSVPAGAAETRGAITVEVNMARIVRIGAPAATVIVGNPGVADVTIQDPKTLVLTGKSYGQTNLIVLDATGNPIADTLIEVVQAQPDLVTVFYADKRTSIACAPDCAPVVMVGDDPSYTQALTTSMGLVQGVVQ
jgi:Flp pilus assembly secretin CpaC